MSFFEKFFQEPEIEPETRKDPIFGTLNSDKYGDWHGRLKLDGRTIRIILEGAPHDPTGYQIRYRESIVENWPTIVANLRHTLFAETDPTESGLTPSEVYDSLQSFVIRIPTDSGFDYDWTLSARSTLDKGDHLIEIFMFGDTHKGYAMQG